MSPGPRAGATLLAPGRVALVTGASSGIGEAFAKALGGRGLNLVLTGRDGDQLARIAGEIEAFSAVHVERLTADLAEPDAPERIGLAVDALGLSPDLLVNNAGGGLLGSFAALPLDRQLQMIRVNVEALVGLTGLFLPPMLARGRGGIVNVSSSAGHQPLPHFAVYAATKAFVTSFSEALWAEVRGRGVRVVAVCPGPVADTRFGLRAGESPMSKIPMLARFRQQPRERVVAQALQALERGDPLAMPGLTNRAIAGASSVVPLRVRLRVTELLFRPPAP
ncbi:MAG: SDR family oxidoreductase [Chloroflexota bacterium]